MATTDRLPEAARAGLDAFTAAARQVFAEDLVSLVLFGSAAEGRLRATSDVNVIVVLARLDPARLKAIGDAYRLAHAAIRLSAMFLLESVRQAAEIVRGRAPLGAVNAERATRLARLRT